MLFSTLLCEGPDAEKFLQGQLTCDMQAVSANALTLACLLNLKGRVVACFWIRTVESGYLLVMPHGMADKLIQILSKYIVFSKATLKNATELLVHLTQNHWNNQTTVEFQLVDFR